MITLRRAKGWEKWPPGNAEWVVTLGRTITPGKWGSYEIRTRYHKRLGSAKRCVRKWLKYKRALE